MTEDSLALWPGESKKRINALKTNKQTKKSSKSSKEEWALLRRMINKECVAKCLLTIDLSTWSNAVASFRIHNPLEVLLPQGKVCVCVYAGWGSFSNTS